MQQGWQREGKGVSHLCGIIKERWVMEGPLWIILYERATRPGQPTIR